MIKHITNSDLFQQTWAVIGGVSIRVKVLGIVVGVIVLLGTFVTLQMQVVLWDKLMTDLEAQGLALAAHLEELVNDVLQPTAGNIPPDLNTLSLVLEERQIHYSSESHNMDVAYIVVLDAERQVIAQTAGASLPEGARTATLVATHEHTILEFSDVLDIVAQSDGDPDTAAANTGTATSGATGAAYILHLGLSKSRNQATVNTVTFQIFSVTLIMVAVGFGAAFFLTWILTRPILSMLEGTRAVAKGDFSRRVRRWANDEIGDLADAFNAMTDSLEQAERERQQREHLRAEYLTGVIRAQENERQRIARELHDSTGQSLTSLLVGLQNLKATIDPVKQEQQIEELRGVIGHTLDEVRTLAWNLRPSALDDLGLVSALQHYIEDYQQRYRIQVDFLYNGMTDRLSMELETTIYRVVQEGLTNIARHAHATSASVILDRRKNAIRIIVEDNGIGFDPVVVREKSLGLLGIRERAALFGGTLTVESTSGQGTTLYLELPLIAGGSWNQESE